MDVAARALVGKVGLFFDDVGMFFVGLAAALVSLLIPWVLDPWLETSELV